MTATQPPTIINFGMLAKPSIYTHTLDEDIREFIQTFENESIANDWDDNTKLKKIRIAFKGIALKIFDEKIKDESHTSTVKTWAGMKAKILETFKKNAAMLRERIKKRQYGGDLDFSEYCMYITKCMREIDPTVGEDKIVSTICDGLPLIERDWIWRYRPQNLTELDKIFGFWLEHKEKMRHKTETETNEEITRLEEKIKALEAKEKNISEIVSAVVTSLGVGGVQPQINAISANTEQQNQNLPPHPTQNVENISSQQNSNNNQSQNIGVNAIQMPVGVIPPQPQQHYQQNQYYNSNRGNYRGRGNNNSYRGNNNRGNGRGNFNNSNNSSYNGQNNRNYNNNNYNNNYRGNYNQNNGYRQYRPRNNNNTYGNSFRPRYPNYGPNQFQNYQGNFNGNMGFPNGNFPQQPQIQMPTPNFSFLQGPTMAPQQQQPFPNQQFFTPNPNNIHYNYSAIPVFNNQQQQQIPQIPQQQIKN